ncbi:hypothetical protein BdWA1_003016 [Babesia duncani]|uniref:Uncharacterized protein n=1 Tax=Babesia duncani TaxID=323732 RepID=A0AAD9UN12_9APIC|nr:hypothetical protein BdWA1_003016 [Babesia duncani]
MFKSRNIPITRKNLSKTYIKNVIAQDKDAPKDGIRQEIAKDKDNEPEAESCSIDLANTQQLKLVPNFKRSRGVSLQVNDGPFERIDDQERTENTLACNFHVISDNVEREILTDLYVLIQLMHVPE